MLLALGGAYFTLTPSISPLWHSLVTIERFRESHLYLPLCCLYGYGIYEQLFAKVTITKIKCYFFYLNCTHLLEVIYCFPQNHYVDEVSKGPWYKDWTAEGVNNFQKTLFPILFLVFTLIFSLCAYFKVGDIEPEDLNA
jgi:hypothetical protein